LAPASPGKNCRHCGNPRPSGYREGIYSDLEIEAFSIERFIQGALCLPNVSLGRDKIAFDLAKAPSM
jgi:hypothetical protein